MDTEAKKAEATNRAHWDEVAPLHLESYRIEDLLAGKSRIDAVQKNELYPVAGKELIHLQCHIGTDTLSLALDGAHVTGVDFSPKSIAIAKELSKRTGIQAEFIEANVLDIKGLLTKQYDIVYTSKGVLSWIRDIRRWAQIIAYLLKDNGLFYILEGHPTSYMFDENSPERLQVKYPYFHQDRPLHIDDDHPDYSARDYVPVNKTFEWIWSIADILSALLEAGLRIEMFHEHDRTFYQAFTGMVQTEDGWWMLKDYPGMIPLAFSVKARRNVQKE